MFTLSQTIGVTIFAMLWVLGGPTHATESRNDERVEQQSFSGDSWNSNLHRISDRSSTSEAFQGDHVASDCAGGTGPKCPALSLRRGGYTPFPYHGQKSRRHPAKSFR